MTGVLITVRLYGAMGDDHSSRDIIAASYRSTAALENTTCHLLDEPVAIAHRMVRPGPSATRVGQVLEGERMPLSWHGERLRTRAYRAAGRWRRPSGSRSAWC